DSLRNLRDTETLKRIRAATERKGGKPGPKRRSHSEWKIDLLRQLASNPMKSVKNFAEYPDTEGSVRVELGRFCRSFYERCILLGARTPQSWQEPKVAQSLREGFGFAFPADLPAASEAYRRGEEKFRRSFPGA